MALSTKQLASSGGLTSSEPDGVRAHYESAISLRNIAPKISHLDIPQTF